MGCLHLKYNYVKKKFRGSKSSNTLPLKKNFDSQASHRKGYCTFNHLSRVNIYSKKKKKSIIFKKEKEKYTP
jgi:hypothetical protein